MEQKLITKTVQYGEHQLHLEIGRIARQAKAAVMVRVGDTHVLCAVTVGKKMDTDFMPLTVHYQERFYAAGRIPGGFFRREGRPTEKEILISRLIDRSLRPLFDKQFRNEVLVVCNVMSLDSKIDADIPAMIGASAALTLSGLPWLGPIGAMRVSYAENDYSVHCVPAYCTGSTAKQSGPKKETAPKCDLDMTVAATADAVLMVESEANELSEDIMLGAVRFAHEQMKSIIDGIKDMAKENATVPFVWQMDAEAMAAATKTSDAAYDSIDKSMHAAFEKAYAVTNKQERTQILADLRAQAVNDFSEQYEESIVAMVCAKLEKTLVRNLILDNKPRIDGRDLKTVRPISVETDILPGTHGSALFTRGETQAIGTVTLGGVRDGQMIDLPEGRGDDLFMLHYNFPPYSVGEAGRMAPPGRREMGHGRLARRALMALLPSFDVFPYTIRVVSEITESNGSSSMASVCVGSLALMAAGVPLRAPVAGVAMGLVKEDNRHAVLTDILGDEDHLGDMDFKVAGTTKGVTALQMDIKITGLDASIMQEALAQARDARLHILEEMNKVLSEARDGVAENAPAFKTFKVPVNKIREIIGRGGETIRAITAETNTTIDVDQDGTVRVSASGRTGLEEAIKRIETLTSGVEEKVEVGMKINGEVMRITNFGAFVNIFPGKDGLVHISQIANERVEKVEDYISEGDMIDVKVIGIDDLGRVKLSIKELSSGN